MSTKKKGKTKSFSFTISVEGILLGVGLYYTWHHNLLAAVACLSIFWLIRMR